MPSDALVRLMSLSTVAAIAHRGGSRLRPENTMAAFEHAVSLGVDAIECDVHLSRDGEAVVIHDPTVDRTTNGTGPVAGFSAEELARLDAGCRFTADDGRRPFAGRGIGVPRLSDVLSRWPDLPFVIEIKGSQTATAERVLAVLEAAGAGPRVIVGGFSLAVLAHVRRDRPALVTSAASDEVRSALHRSWFRLAPRRTGYALFQVPVRLRGRRVLSRPFVRAARRAGVPVQAWIVDEVEEMRRLIAWGVTGLISDRPDRAVAEARRAATGAA